MMDKQSHRIVEQAAEYFAGRVRATTAQDAEREAWLRADPRHAQAYDEMQRLWQRTGHLGAHDNLLALKAADLAALRRSQSWFRPTRMLAMAATLVMVLGGGAYLFLQLQAPSPPVSYATVLGERRTETLPDGTEIVLNTASQLQVRYSRRLREVELQQGEAQFEVAHDAARPFVVRIGYDTVTALGTRFQVRRNAEDITVILLQGEVAVENPQGRWLLQPNQKAELSSGGTIAVRTVDPAQATGWLDGWLRFRGVPLAEVVAEANRYSARKLRLGDPSLAGLEMSGSFHAGDNASIALGAQVILPVRVDDSGADIVLLPQ